MLPKPQILMLFGASGPRLPDVGPLQSIAALMEATSSRFSFHFAAAADLRPRAQRCAPMSRWHEVKGINYFWIEPGTSRLRWIRDELRNGQWELVMLNSFFDREFTLPVLLMMKFGIVPRLRTIVSPRGEFAAGALSLKSFQKRMYLKAVRALGLLDHVWLHATAEHEQKDIDRQELRVKGILLAPNPRSLPESPPGLSEAREAVGALKIAFLGRITPVKNLHYAIEVLGKVAVPAELHVFGPVGDPSYSAECQWLAAALPKTVRVLFQGILPHDQVTRTLADYDLFMLPTLGENFGHAIHEALSAGVPALISDRTPWRGLSAAGAGWDLRLEDQESFVRAIEAVWAKSPIERQLMRRAARRFAEQSYERSTAIEATTRMIEIALERIGA